MWGLRSPNLVTNLFDFGAPDFIEHGDNVTVERKHLRADRDFDPRIVLMQFIKVRENIVLREELTVDVNGVTLANLDGDKILGRICRRRSTGWQLYPNALHVGLAQANHHETGEEKEHDVDQRNDLDTCALARNR